MFFPALHAGITTRRIVSVMGSVDERKWNSVSNTKQCARKLKRIRPKNGI
jgi:hypothetical protein